jgi:hypothetical protein
MAPDLERLARMPCPTASFGVLRHQLLQLDFRGIMIEEGLAGLAKHACKFRPGSAPNLARWTSRLSGAQA